MASSQRYERITTDDDTDHVEGPRSPSTIRNNGHHNASIPSSPPPSFRSRASSPTSRRFLQHDDPLSTDADRALNDAFDSPSDDEHDDEDDFQDAQDRRRLISDSAGPVRVAEDQNRPVERRAVTLPAFQPTLGRVYGGGNSMDGVFANLSAKPARGEVEDEKPPSYEAAAADATPPYWETTILAPGMMSDEVYVDGLPVGSVFSFLWNAMITVSFQIVGFLLTYLLHTTHAAKNGSRAGLGFTLIQFGYSSKGTAVSDPTNGNPTGGDFDTAPPSDPNSHDYDSGNLAGGDAATPVGFFAAMSADWFAYTLIIIGWFILIKALSDFYRARRHEQLVLQSPDRGLGVAVVADGEHPESSV